MKKTHGLLRRLIAVVLALLMLFAASGCKKETDEPDTPPSTEGKQTSAVTTPAQESDSPASGDPKPVTMPGETGFGNESAPPSSGDPAPMTVPSEIKPDETSNTDTEQTPDNDVTFTATFSAVGGGNIEMTAGIEIDPESEAELEVTVTGYAFSEDIEDLNDDLEALAEAFHVYGLPEGIEVAAIEFVDTDTLRLKLSGIPTVEEGDDSDYTLTLTIAASQFGDTSDEDIIAEGDVIFAVVAANDDNTQDEPHDAVMSSGTINMVIGEETDYSFAVTLDNGLEFKTDIDPEAFILENLPEGITYDVLLVSTTEVLISLLGTPETESEGEPIVLTISKDQFVEEPDEDVLVYGSIVISVTSEISDIPSELPTFIIYKFPIKVKQVVVAEEPAKPPVVLYAVCAVALAAVAFASYLVGMRAGYKRKKPQTAAVAPTEPTRIDPIPNSKAMSKVENISPSQYAKINDSVTRLSESSVVSVAKLHNIGRRQSQQDSMGVAGLDNGLGVLAVVADGMGGLSGGDKISQAVVMSMLKQISSIGAGQMDGVLGAMVKSANSEANRLIDEQKRVDKAYSGGTTLVAALVRGGAFHWISVGDSRVYLYRSGSIVQLNQEHTYEIDLMQKVLNGEMSAAEAAKDPQRRGLTSYIGMGRLKHVDASLRRIKLMPGDRIMLMTDGVFNRLPETTIADIVCRNPDVQKAAKVLEDAVIALKDPAQDNFTAIILGIQ